MAQLLKGERVGRRGALRFGCSATIFDASRQNVLLTRRADNGQWCLPGGGMDPGESAAEACQREIMEEIGLQIELIRLLGVYSNPDYLVTYADGNRYQIVALNFEGQVAGGELGTSSEVTEHGYFSLQACQTLDIMEHHRIRIQDAFSDEGIPFIR